MDTCIQTELQELEALLDRLKRGELTRQDFRAQSVHYGVYTQKQPDRFVVRLRVPCGILSPEQLKALAHALDTSGPGKCHLTTRQGVEVHDLFANQIMPLLHALANADLLSHESGGNSVRSMMVCPHAGVGPAEPFDVTPYAQWLGKHLVRHPEFQSLPRKMKIGFTCCEEDCAHSALQDVGFQARLNADGRRGFRVLVGGGTGAAPRLGQEIIPFLPAEEILSFAKAVLRVFNRIGNRQNRQRARLKFLIQDIGLERFKGEVLEARSALEREGNPPDAELSAKTTSPTRLHKAPARDLLADSGKGNAEFAAWRAAQVQPQADKRFRMVRVSLAGGSVTSAQLKSLGELLEKLGLDIRTTPEQGFLLRGARPGHLPQIYEVLNHAGLLKPVSVSHLVTCPGSSTCSNAFTNAPGLAQALTARLAAQSTQSEALAHLRLRLSGCPNGCALHAIAALGLEGVATRAVENWFPAYRLWLGGSECQAHPRFGTDLGLLPAQRVPDCVAEITALYLKERHPDESLETLVERLGLEPFTSLVQKFQSRPEQTQSIPVRDWGDTDRYQPRADSRRGVC